MNKKVKITFKESSKGIQDRVDDFYNQIKSKIKHIKEVSSKLSSGKNNKSIRDLCLKERSIIETLYSNTNTQHSYFTKYRRHPINLSLKDHHPGIYEIVMDIMKLSSGDSDQRALQRDEMIDIKTNNLALFEVESFVSACQKLLSSFIGDDPLADKNYSSPYDDLYTLVIAIMGLTGRRSIEILKTGKFRYINFQYVLFSGQAKTKGSPNGRTSYRIPVLADAKMIIAGMRLIRKKFPISSWENEKINAFFSAKLIKRIGLLQHCVFPNQHVKLNARTLRSLYVASAYHMFSMSTKVSFNAFAAKVLGHSHLDKNTANCYTYYGVCNPEHHPKD